MKQLLSEVTSAGQLRLTIADVPEPELAAHEVLIRVEATPINPSDLGLLLGPVDLSTLRRDGDATVGEVAAAHMAGMAARLGEAMPVGNEGGGVVVAAGSSPAAQALMGRVVGAVGGAMYGEFRAVPAQSCLAMPEGVTPAQAASPFVNPLTALSMVENMRLDGHSALVHTAAASNLGQMLVKICLADGVGLVNIVRRPEHVALLRSIGAEHVCDSSSPTFDDDLVAALSATGATIAFDALSASFDSEIFWISAIPSLAETNVCDERVAYSTPYGRVRECGPSLAFRSPLTSPSEACLKSAYRSRSSSLEGRFVKSLERKTAAWKFS